MPNTSIILHFILAAVGYIFSLQAFLGKDSILSNIYVQASEEEKAQMDKKDFSLQSGIIFLCLGTVTLLRALSIILQLPWLSYVTIVIFVAGATYAILSERALKKKYKK